MSEHKLSLRKRSALLAKGAKATLKADKELVVFPILHSLVASVLLVVFALTVFFGGHATGNLFQENFTWQSNPWVTIPTVVTTFVLATFAAHYFEAAVYSGAMQRFNGEDPTVSSALRAVNKKFKPLLLFSLMMSTVGLILQFLENKVPLAGKIAIWLFGAAWAVANVFAVPYIVSTKKDVTPIEATKKSVGLIKKVWGENMVASFSVGLIGLWWMFLSGLITGLIGAALMALQTSPSLAIAIPITLFIGSLMVIITIIGTLTTLVKAAVFHYATTGESPEGFSKELLRATMTPKKSKKLFKI